MVNYIYTIRDKIFNLLSKFFSPIFKEAKGTITDWVKPKIQNLPGIIILILASIGLHSIICDLSIWVFIKELPFVFSSTICIPSAVSILTIILLVKIIECNGKVEAQ